VAATACPGRHKTPGTAAYGGASIGLREGFVTMRKLLVVMSLALALASMAPSLASGAGTIPWTRPLIPYALRLPTCDRASPLTGANGLPPKVRTTAAIGVAGTEAVVRGVIDARDQPTRFKFEYGPTRSYGMTTEASEEVLTGHVNTAVAEALAGLNPRTIYHYRIVAFNRSGSVRGKDRTFTTTRRR
jgi:hypothetical protein